MQRLPPIVSLIPHSGLQFLDIRFSIDQLPRTPRVFWEQPLPPGQSAANLVNLRELRPDDTGTLLDPVSGITPPDGETYTIGRNQALEPFLNRWVPIPYFRVAAVAAAGKEVYDKGPTNWARAHIHELSTPDERAHTHHLVIAFDTVLRPREEGRPYTAVSLEDSSREGEFAFVAGAEETNWFVSEPWMAQWLEELLREHRQAGGRRPRTEDATRACEHWARYASLIGLIAEAAIMPRLKLVDVVSTSRSYEPISVDLVLDIGNARTCGILVEDVQNARLNFNNSYALKLRDLSMPHRGYEDPFESRVEFARASFGKEAIARRAGRANAFAWASPVRVGPEAVRLSAASRGNEGATGLSSPKRYLWDERLTSQVWRFNGLAADGMTTEPPVSGAFMQFLSEGGEVLRAKPRRRQAGQLQPAVRARFSRSSLMTFMLTEILMQAQSQINAVETRYEQTFPDVPRRLRRILLTMPPAMPLAEQRIFRDRAEAAVRLAWDMMGWGSPGPSTPPEPRVMANLDEATATQLVFLYTEASQRLRGDPGGFFALSGRHRAAYGAAPSLRVASIDIGGGTTDLMICTFASEHGQEIEPRQNFREGFRIAGDEVLRETIQTVILPQIELGLTAAGARDAKAMLQDVLGGDRGSQSELERHLRKQLITQILEPAGLAILHAYERSTDRAKNEILRATLKELLPDRDVSAPIEYLAQKIGQTGAAGFDLLGLELTAFAPRLDAVVQASLGPILADLCEVIHAFDCDWLLLSGRPSRMRAITDLILAKMPVPPHRIVGMHHYAAGSWYPFRDPAGRVKDPKTTAAVGAMLCAMAEGRLEGFLMRTSRLSMRSTARYLGRMELSGQIKHASILLRDPDRTTATPAAPAAPPEVKFNMEFRAPVFLGFRQLELERWPATRLYVLEYANPDNVPRLKLPLHLTIQRAEVDPESADAEEKREDFEVVEILDADHDPQHKSVVRLRLQTERSEAGYWRDTGALSVP
jgi:hypothetical protein